jgi:hypothetical protein
MTRWLFYAGPENYLDTTGVRTFVEDWTWSCEAETVAGDLALLYRRSLKEVSVKQLVERLGMSRDAAKVVKASDIGSDIAAVWRVTSGNLGPLRDWPASCQVRQLASLTPPLTLREMKALPALRGWEDLRWSFQAQGRAALEIPESVWPVLRELIKKRITATIPELG